MREYKVVLFGSGGVGKSALTQQFIHRKFIENYSPTVEDVYRKYIEVGGRRSLIEVLDTAGTEQFASMRDLYIRNGEGFLIVYSLTSRESFSDITTLKQQILAIKRRKNAPVVLVANKCDLADGQRPSSKRSSDRSSSSSSTKGGEKDRGKGANGSSAPDVTSETPDGKEVQGSSIGRREVSVEEGENLARTWDCPFFETSAKAVLNVNEAFSELIQEIVTMTPTKKKSSCAIL